MPKPKLKTRQALSIARIRAERRAQKLCIDCGALAAVKVLKSGKAKVLSYCQRDLDRIIDRRK